MKTAGADTHGPEKTGNKPHEQNSDRHDRLPFLDRFNFFLNIFQFQPLDRACHPESKAFFLLKGRVGSHRLPDQPLQAVPAHRQRHDFLRNRDENTGAWRIQNFERQPAHRDRELNGQFLAAFLTAALQNISAVLRAHSLAESVRPLPFDIGFCL